MHKVDVSKIKLKSIAQNDIPFLYQVYRSTRLEELAPANFSEVELESFLKMQFNLQHTQYMQSYSNPSFDIIVVEDTPVGRLYVNRDTNDIRIIDVALLTEHRRKGIARKLFEDLIAESETKKVSLSLHVEHENPIMHFYKELGFKCGQDKGIYLFMKRRPRPDFRA